MGPLLEALAFASFLLAQIAAVATVCAARRARGSGALDAHALSAAGVLWTCVALGTLFCSCRAYAEDLQEVARKFLQRHGVPCEIVLKVGSPRDMGEIATCQDGREWALFWLEDEIAFVHTQTGEAYKWDRQIYLSYPDIYSGLNSSSKHSILVSDGQ